MGGVSMLIRFVIAIALAMPLASHSGNEQVTGSVVFSAGGGFLKLNFSCTGSPTCTGFFSGVAHDAPCADFALSDGFTITGLDLSHPGSLSGTITIAHDYTTNAMCVYSITAAPGVIDYSGFWNGTTGPFTLGGNPVDGTFAP